MSDADNLRLLDDPNWRVAVLGKEIENVLGTEIGQYLIQCAEREASEAADELKTVWPWRTRRIRELQNRIWVAEHFQKWLGDAIVAGRQATNYLRGKDDETQTS